MVVQSSLASVSNLLKKVHVSCTEEYKVRQLQHRYLLGSRSWTESQAHKDQAIVIGEEAHGRAPLLLSQPEKNRQQTTGIFDRTT